MVAANTRLLVMLVLFAHDRAERLSVRHRAQGLLPAAGYRRADRHGVQADQATSFQAMRTKLQQLPHCRRQVRSGGGQRGGLRRRGSAATNTANLFVALKPLSQRHAECRTRSSPGCARNCSPASPARGCSCRRCRTCASAAGRPTRNTSTRCRRRCAHELYKWAPKLTDAMQKTLPDVGRREFSDQQERAWNSDLTIDRVHGQRAESDARSTIDNTLYDAFGQRQVSDDLHAAQPVSRGHGSGAALLAKRPDAPVEVWVSTSGAQKPPSGTSRPVFPLGTVSSSHHHRPATASQRRRIPRATHQRTCRFQERRVQRRFGQHVEGNDGAAGRVQSLPARPGRSPSTIQGAFVAATISFNLPRRQNRSATPRRHRERDGKPPSACRPHRGRALPAPRPRFQAIDWPASRCLILAALLSRLYRARHPLRKLRPPRSPSCPPCPPPAWARCWRCC